MPSAEKRFTPGDFGGGGVGARSCTERFEMEFALILRRREEFFRCTMAANSVADSPESLA